MADDAEGGGVMPQRIQRKRTKGWRKPEGAVIVDRSSRWGNPFSVYKGHTTIGPSWHVARATWGRIPKAECTAAYVTSSRSLGHADAVALFEDLLKVRARDERRRLREWLSPLVGKDLACWCPAGQACHADVLLRFVNEVA